MPLVKTNVDQSRSPVIIPFAILAVLALLGGLATLLAVRHGGEATAGGTGDAVPAISKVTPTSFSAHGPYGVGETTLHLASNGAAVEVWYPISADQSHGTQATFDLTTLLPASLASVIPHNVVLVQSTGGLRGVPMADGRFPLVVFSHGFAGFPTQSSFLTSHLASWGFVVAAPDHTDRDLSAALKAALSGQSITQSNDVNDLKETISLMTTEAATSSSPFYRHLDLARIGAVGHSAGGSAVEQLAASDSSVKVFVGLAGASYGTFGQTASGPGSKVPDQPGMLMYAAQDSVVPAGWMKNAYNALNQPKRLVGLSDSGHLVFSDICVLGSAGGGLVGAAQQAGLPIPSDLLKLGTDGCGGSANPVRQEWPVINQAVTAQLRWALGYDSTQAGLDGLGAAFGPLLVEENTTASSVAGADPSGINTGRY